MTLDDWVLACRAAGYMPVLTAMRQSPGGTGAAPVVVGIEPQWLAGKYAGEPGHQRFVALLEGTWAAECESWGAMQG